MLRKIFRITVMSALTLGLLGSGTARGVPLLAENFEGLPGGKVHAKGKETSWGRGWQAKAGGDAEGANRDVLTFPAAGHIRADQGTVELDLVRDNSHDVETLLAVGTEERGLVLVSIRWKGRAPYKKVPVLVIESKHPGAGLLWFREQEMRISSGKYRTFKKEWI
ncbi:MAG: hypothetical protein ACYSWU_20780, partial [Planctomycetota bacterium]